MATLKEPYKKQAYFFNNIIIIIIIIIIIYLFFRHNARIKVIHVPDNAINLQVKALTERTEY